ncbi:uncharacterized protein G2W53_001297 [Senna tora]|uniref:Uncharacterized protein n=1 Tax=Senna tora TaxID=362788 RepID=A0A834XFY2_9FABA|nr:uncharacterized protein G2W53_001297 [Senna tora]
MNKKSTVAHRHSTVAATRESRLCVPVAGWRCWLAAAGMAMGGRKEKCV